MKQNIYNYKNYMGIAMKFLRIEADAEDAVQNALLLYLKYKDKLNTEIPEKTINWLVKQECVRSYRKKNNITIGENGKLNHGKFIDIDYLTFALDHFNLLRKDDPRRKMLQNSVYFDFNEGPENYDIKVLNNNKNTINKYFNIRQIKPDFKFTVTEKSNGHTSLAVNGKYIKTFKT